MAAVRSGAAAHIVVDIHQVGGLLAARRCAAVAEAGGLSVSLAAERSVGVAVAAMLQTAAATPAFASGNHTDYYNLKDDVLDDGFDIIDGMAAVPQSPGLGVRVDRRKVERRQGA
jgi:glucarate dehydratase